MEAIEHAKAVEHWVSGDSGIRGEECRAAAAELRRLAEVNAELLMVLERTQQNINWMLNERKFLNGHVFDYLEDAINKATE